MKCKESAVAYRFCYMLAFMSSSLFSFGLSACGVFQFMPDAGTEFVENGNVSNNPVIIVTMELLR